MLVLLGLQLLKISTEASQLKSTCFHLYEFQGHKLLETFNAQLFYHFSNFFFVMDMTQTASVGEASVSRFPKF